MRQPGSPPRKRGRNLCNGRGKWIRNLDGTKNRCLTKSELQCDGANRWWTVMSIGYTKTAPGTTYPHAPQVVHKRQRTRSQKKQKLKVLDHTPSKIKYHEQIINNKGDVPHTDKKSTESGERHQLSNSDKHQVILGRYNPSEDIDNINKLDKLH